MKKTKIFLVFLLGAITLLLFLIFSKQHIENQVFSDITNKFRGLKSYKAEFINKITDDGEFIIKGYQLYKYPYKTKAVYSPEKYPQFKDIDISDGKTKWLYISLLRKVLKIDLLSIRTKSENYVQYMDYIDRGKIKFVKKNVLNEAKVYIIEGPPNSLFKKQSKINVANVVLYIGVKDGIVRRIIEYDESNNVIADLTYYNIERNVNINDREFIFQVPDGAEVVDITQDIINTIY